jgi:hypothetical protein
MGEQLKYLIVPKGWFVRFICRNNMAIRDSD